MSNVPLPIGVCLRPEYDEYSLAKLGEYSRAAEAHGFDSVWLAESWGHDSLALLSHIGTLTRRVRLGTAIVNVFSRTPALLAMASVTLGDLLTGASSLALVPARAPWWRTGMGCVSIVRSAACAMRSA